MNRRGLRKKAQTFCGLDEIVEDKEGNGEVIPFEHGAAWMEEDAG